MKRVGSRREQSYQSVARFMISDDLLFFFGHFLAFALRPAHDAFDRLLQFADANGLFVQPRGQKRGLINNIRQIRAGKIRGLFRNNLKIDALIELHFPGVHLEYGFTPRRIRQWHHHLAVEAARP